MAQTIVAAATSIWPRFPAHGDWHKLRQAGQIEALPASRHGSCFEFPGMRTDKNQSTEKRAPKIALGERFAEGVARWTGSAVASSIALGCVAVWVIIGPMFHWSDTWQLVMNTTSSVVTFLMVFLIQRSQNKDAIATQVKLNEIVAAMEGASNRIVSVEDLSEGELQRLKGRYQTLVDRTSAGPADRAAVSIEETADPEPLSSG